MNKKVCMVLFLVLLKGVSFSSPAVATESINQYIATNSDPLRVAFLDKMIEKTTDKVAGKMKRKPVKEYQCPDDLTSFKFYKFEEHWKAKHPQHLSREYNNFVKLDRIIKNRKDYSSTKFNNKFTKWFDSYSAKYPQYA